MATVDTTLPIAGETRIEPAIQRNVEIAVGGKIRIIDNTVTVPYSGAVHLWPLSESEKNTFKTFFSTNKTAQNVFNDPSSDEVYDFYFTDEDLLIIKDPINSAPAKYRVVFNLVGTKQ